MDREKFIKLLEQKDLAGDKLPFNNPDGDCAAIVLGKMLEENKIVRAYFHHLGGEILMKDDSLSKLEVFLNNPENKIEIIIDDIDPFHDELRRLFTFAKSIVNIRQSHILFKKEMSIDDGIRYFMTAGPKAYRSQPDSDIYMALGSFQDKDHTSVLNDVFYSFWDRTENIALSN